MLRPAGQGGSVRRESDVFADDTRYAIPIDEEFSTAVFPSFASPSSEGRKPQVPCSQIRTDYASLLELPGLFRSKQTVRSKHPTDPPAVSQVLEERRERRSLCPSASLLTPTLQPRSALPTAIPSQPSRGTPKSCRRSHRFLSVSRCWRARFRSIFVPVIGHDFCSRTAPASSPTASIATAWQGSGLRGWGGSAATEDGGDRRRELRRRKEAGANRCASQERAPRACVSRDRPRQVQIRAHRQAGGLRCKSVRIARTMPR